MPGKGHVWSAKADRMASHIQDSEEESGKAAKTARSIAYATLNKRKPEWRNKLAAGMKARTKKGAL